MTKTYRRYRYETDDQFNADAYKTERNEVAWSVLGWEVEANEDTEWTGMYERTGNILAVMVGDDRVFQFEDGALMPVESYCGGCGQIGCGEEVSK